MILILKNDHTKEQLHDVCEHVKNLNLQPHVVCGQQGTTISLMGKTQEINTEEFETLAGIEKVFRVSKPYKMASIEGRRERTTIRLRGLHIGGRDNFIVMAGPCSVESEEQTLRIAHQVKKAGATILRGGAFKPRSSPYSFQGMGLEGLKILKKASEETGLLIVSEVMDIKNVPAVAEHVDIIQIGARNMQNFALLKELGRAKKPVMLKRGISGTIEEWLMSAEYIMSHGNDQVILCERGIRSYDNKFSRNTLDLNAVPILKHLTHLPIIVDPSHGTGHRYMVSPMSKAALAAGADGLIIEVHDRPQEALSDGPQSLLPEDFTKLMGELAKLSLALGLKLEKKLEEEKISA